MKAREMRFLDLLGQKDSRFVIPPFQRVYSWSTGECETLFEDIMAAGKKGVSHFAGMMLYLKTDEDDGTASIVVIDGQQRMTTLTLMIKAYADLAGEDGSGFTWIDADCKDLLCTQDGKQPKLQLTSLDSEALEEVLGLRENSDDESMPMQTNSDHFIELMKRPGFDEEAFEQGLKGLKIIAMELDSNDSPQDVFESLNSKGKMLAIQDLLRNALLENLGSGDEAERIYEQYWLSLEETVDGVNGVDMDDVICAWMASNHANTAIKSRSEVYPMMMRCLQRRFGGSFPKMLADMRSYASRLAGNDQLRRDELHDAKLWVEGKPRGLVSDLKMFGD